MRKKVILVGKKRVGLTKSTKDVVAKSGKKCLVIDNINKPSKPQQFLYWDEMAMSDELARKIALDNPPIKIKKLFKTKK